VSSDGDSSVSSCMSPEAGADGSVAAVAPVTGAVAAPCLALAVTFVATPAVPAPATAAAASALSSPSFWAVSSSCDGTPFSSSNVVSAALSPPGGRRGGRTPANDTEPSPPLLAAVAAAVAALNGVAARPPSEGLWYSSSTKAASRRVSRSARVVGSSRASAVSDVDAAPAAGATPRRRSAVGPPPGTGSSRESAPLMMRIAIATCCAGRCEMPSSSSGTCKGCGGVRSERLIGAAAAVVLHSYIFLWSFAPSTSTPSQGSSSPCDASYRSAAARSTSPLARAAQAPHAVQPCPGRRGQMSAPWARYQT
jgi:hypothetical protein